MSFNTLDYMLFLPAVILLYFLLPVKLRNPLLLAASYAFYICGVPVLCLFLIAVTAVSYAAGLVTEYCKSRGNYSAAKAATVIGITICFGTLFFYKYFNLLSETVFSILGRSDSAVQLDTLVPLGISFIIFQTVSYIVDVYRGDIRAERRFFRFALYVSFFPKVAQGPIEKAGDILPQFDEEHEFDSDRLRYGFTLILFGMFLKMVVADNLAICVNTVYGNLTSYSGAAVCAATVMFAFQIYCDFAGYSLIALGSAGALGFKLMQNFRQPYLSRSVSEFWRRWHISLNVWLRDYIYIPLGGSRCSGARRWTNTLLTFGFSGLWHGADWGYLIWGLLNGFCVSVESTVKRLRKKRSKQAPSPSAPVRLLKLCGTFIIISFSWLFFRAQDIPTAVTALGRIVHDFDLRDFVGCVLSQLRLGEGHLLFGLDVSWRIPYLAFFVLLVIISDILTERHGLARKIADGPFILRWTVYLFLLFAIIIFGVYGYGYDAAGFIYGAF